MSWTRSYVAVWRTLDAFGRSIEAAVAPVSCVFCGTRLKSGQMPVCSGCHGDLPWRSPPFVLTPFTGAAAPFSYTFPIDAAIRMLKFRRQLRYAPAFAALLQPALASLPADVDALLPIPLHWRRQAVRGFNQAAEIARPLQRHFGLPLLRNVIRSRATPFQSGLGASHRRRNLNGAFKVRGELSSRHVLLLDDVVTTGTTCRELAKTLLRSGVEEVSVLAIARSQQD